MSGVPRRAHTETLEHGSEGEVDSDTPRAGTVWRRKENMDCSGSEVEIF